jgi:hypothetical protein
VSIKSHIHNLDGKAPMIAWRVSRKLAPRSTAPSASSVIGFIGAGVFLFIMGTLSAALDFVGWQMWWPLGLACSMLPVCCFGSLLYGLLSLL